MASFDLVVVGAGIVGLAHAFAAERRGLRVAVVDRDARATEASVRNFGFVTVSGQAAGVTRARALRSRDVWEEAAAAAGIAILQRGAVVVARRPEALAVLQAFAASDMGERCEIWDGARAQEALPMLAPSAAGAMWSPHELRVEAREAMPRLAAWLEARGVSFHWGCSASAFDAGRLRHAAGSLEAAAAVFAPGNALPALFPAIAARERMRVCKLQMLRLAPQGWKLPAVAMSDLSLVRYAGFVSMPASVALRARLEEEAAEALARGIHLIVAQGDDGSLVVGDSHAYGETADPFCDAITDSLILQELHSVLRVADDTVMQRWNGYYPVAEGEPLLRESVGERARVVVVTSGTGMSTAFAIGEETIAEMFG